MNWTKFFTLLLLLSFFSIPSGLVYAQSDRGTIAGLVTDASGAVVPDATVTVINVKTDTKSVVTSTSSGNYTMPQVQSGTYRITVEKQGFKTAVRDNFPLLVGQNMRVDFTLEVGEVTQTVEVEAAAPQLKPESSELSTSVTNQQISELPLPMAGEARSPINFIALVPGVTGAQSGAGYGNNTTGRTFGTSVNGGQTFAFEIQVDGATIQNTNVSGDFRNIPFPQDAVQEFKVETGNFAAEYGRTGGGIVSFTTRSGTNEFHGSVYDYFRNNVLDARGFYAASVPKLNQNEFGVNVGGPVWIPKLYNGKNKTFFFFYYDGFRYRSGAANFLTTVPTQLERNGDFSDLRNASGQLIPIFDPATTRVVDGKLIRDPFPGNVIPQSRFSTVAKNVLAYVPLPNFNPDQPFNNYRSTQGGTNDTNQWGFRIDQTFGAKQRLSGWYGFNKFYGIDAAGAGALSGPVSTAGVTDHPQQILRLNWDWFIRPNLIQHGTFGFNRSKFAGVPLVYEKNYNETLGITGAQDVNGFPRFNFSENYHPWGSGGGENTNIENGFVGVENITWIKSKHTFKFGFDMRKNQENMIFNGVGLGQYNYSNLETGLPNTTATGNPFASFLLGQVDTGRLFVNNTVFGWRYEYYAWYFQDTYKVTPKLTLNYGLRYELPFPRGEAYDRMSNFSNTTPNPGAGGIPGALVFTGTGPGKLGIPRFFPADKKEFGPRVGIAYQLRPNTVVRAAYGVYYVGAGSVLDNGQRTAYGIGYFADVTRSTQDNGITPAFNIDNGFPQNFLYPPSLDPSFQNGSAGNWMEPGRQRQPYVQNWNLNVQHQFGSNLLLDVAYVGNKGTRLPSNLTTPDQVDPKWLYLGNELNANISCLGDGTCPNAVAGIKSPYARTNNGIAQALRPYPQYMGL
ncbi:MAG: TonB-dependent receptor [Terriglobia bacterium]